MDTWEDKNTKEKRSRMKVVLESFQFLSEGKGGQAESPPAREAGAAAGAAKPAAQENLDEDVPF